MGNLSKNELRIGNLTNNNGYISAITGQDIYDLSQGMDSECFQPIPLTEEWLLKFGFEKCLNQYKKVTETKPFIILFLEGQFQYDDLRYRTNLQYVHQLQNLYFALTGEELKIIEK